MMEASNPIRVLIAKPGLDGHDVGAKLICRALRDAGMEVIYTGLRQTPQAIAKAAVDEGVQVVGLSILSGAHMPLCSAVVAALQDAGARDVKVIAGGNIPRTDHPALAQLGVSAVFNTGASFDAVVAFVRQEVTHA